MRLSGSVRSFSGAKHHLAVAPKRQGYRFSDEIMQDGYDHTKQLKRIQWDGSVDFSFITEDKKKIYYLLHKTTRLSPPSVISEFL